MRKDAKIGFAIGGVLLAVIVAYVLAGRHHNVSSNTVTLVTPPASTDSNSEQPPPSVPAASNDKPLASSNDQAPAPAKADDTVVTNDNKNDGVNWAKLLSGDAPPPLLSSTPGPSDAASSSSNSASASTASNTATPPADDSGAAMSGGVTNAANTPSANPPQVLLSAANTQSPPTRIVMGATTQPSVAGKTYTIQPNQTLSSIAAEVYGNQRFYVAIMRANPTVNPNRLHAGQKIILPDISEVTPETSTVQPSVKKAPSVASDSSGKTYIVKSGDTLYRISKALFGSTKEANAIYDLNQETIGADKAKLRLGMVLKLPAAPTVADASTR
jgi:nucleoid-associated protein YgaU